MGANGMDLFTARNQHSNLHEFIWHNYENSAMKPKTLAGRPMLKEMVDKLHINNILTFYSILTILQTKNVQFDLVFANVALFKSIYQFW